MSREGESISALSAMLTVCPETLTFGSSHPLAGKDWPASLVAASLDLCQFL
jgi:hypothetical protein